MASKQTPITDDQRKVLEIDRNHPDATPKDILGMLDDPDLTVDYVQRVIHDFELPEEQPSAPTQLMSSVQEADPDEDEQAPTTTTERPLDTLGDRAREVVEAVQDDPEITVQELEDDVECSSTHIHNTVRQFSQLLPDDAAIWDQFNHPEETESPDEVNGKKAKAVVKAICDDPSKTKNEIVAETDSEYAYVTTVMQIYQHLLPDEWCNRFPSLCGGDTLPRAHGDAVANADQTHNNHGGGASEEPSGADYDPDFDPQDERRRLENLHDIGMIDDETLEEKLAELEDEADTEEEAEEIVDEAEDEAEEEDESTSTTISPDMATETADDSDNIKEPDMETPSMGEVTAPADKVTVVDPEKVDQLNDQLELLEDDSSGELAAYAKGIQYTLNVLDIDE